MNVLGISAFYHDSAACLVRNGEIIAAAQEERFSRLKHDAGFPAAAIRYCLNHGRLTGADLDLVVFHEKPFLRFERLLETYLQFAPRGFGQFAQAIPQWLRRKLWIRDVIQRETGYQGRILFPTHHESHAAAAFYPSPYEEAAILTMDGVGEWATAAMGAGAGNRITLRRELRFPHSLGLLYSAFTAFAGFAINDGEYKLMGLAPYGEPVYRDLILSELVDLREDGSLRMNMEYFNYCTGLTMTSPRFNDLFGAAPRPPGSSLRQVDMDMARSIQEVTEEVVLRMASFARRETGSRKLVMSGGVALNSVANGKLEREGVFDEIWIQPAAGDAGSALGAALYGWYQYLENDRGADGRRDAMGGALLGPAWSDGEIEEIVKRSGLAYRRLDTDKLLDAAADRLARGQVVGWFQGRMEFGPRALGNRSILADARNPEMQERVNARIKFREGFRPFAPAVLAARAGDFFHMAGDSPYMLKVFPVRDEHLLELSREDRGRRGLDKLKVVRSDMPAVTHVDGSARVQTVDGEYNPLFAGLIGSFNDKTGTPLVVNTSFNVRGEPIVCSPVDALSCFLRTGIDSLVLGSFLLDRSAQLAPEETVLRALASLVRVPAGDSGTVRRFALSMGCGLALWSMLVWWLYRWPFWWVPLAAGGALTVTGVVYPRCLKPFHDLWSRVGGWAGRAGVFLVLMVVYYGVLVPTSAVARLLGRIVLSRGFDPGARSYWYPVEVGAEDSHYKQY